MNAPARTTCYFVAGGGVVLGVLDGDPDVVVSVDEPGVAVGGGVLGGEADGVRSLLGRSPTRLEPLSVQAVARVATSASAERPKSALFMDTPPWGFDPGAHLQRRCHRRTGGAQRGPHSPAAIA